MAMIFSKRLTTIDITVRLTIPTKALHHINMPEGVNNVDVTCRYVPDGTVWTFRCNKRRNGHPKPAFNRTGWLEFVRAKELRIGDEIIFGMQEDEAGGGGAAYTIQARRDMTLMGNQFMADI